MSELYPTDLKLSDQGSLTIVWNDGWVQEIAPRTLRRACPCARCQAELLAAPKPSPLFPMLTPAQARPLGIARMTPVGNYAYTIDFSDGHNSGIYSFEFLRHLQDAGPPNL